jgi:hypothetical protein
MPGKRRSWQGPSILMQRAAGELNVIYVPSAEPYFSPLSQAENGLR